MTAPFNNNNLSGISENNSIHDIEQRLNVIETRLTSIEDDLYGPVGNSFASNGTMGTMNVGELAGGPGPNQPHPLNATLLDLGATNVQNISGNDTTLGGKKRKTKKQKKTKKRGNKGKRLTKRNRK
jgi:hypothetical protein